jgi:hypothetical protein
MESSEMPAGQGTKKWDAFTVVRWGDQALAWANRVMTVSRYEALESRVEKIGHYALIAAAALGLIYGIVAAFKWDQLSPFLMGIAWLPCVGVAQYAAFKFSSTARGLIRTSGSQLSSQSFLVCLALWSLILGIITLVGFTYMAIRMDSFSSFGMGVGAFVIFELVVWLCLNPVLLNISIIPASTAGEEAIGVLTFFMKTLLRLVPIAFGVGVIVGDVEIIAAIIRLFRGQEYSVMGVASGAWMVLGSAALPLIGYVLFVLNYLVLDIIRAILSVPGKLDIIGRK